MRELVETRVGYQLKRVQHALRGRMDEALRSMGLTTPQYAALSALEGAPGLSGAELARRSFVTPQTMNGVLANLEAAGLIERHPHPEHGRVLQAYLTEPGEELVSRTHRVVEDIEERMLAYLDEDSRILLAEMLRACTDSLEGNAGRVADTE
ncbi:MAG: MarR family transcriptional regulator [Rubrobacteraceae bacterium]